MRAIQFIIFLAAVVALAFAGGRASLNFEIENIHREWDREIGIRSQLAKDLLKCRVGQ